MKVHRIHETGEIWKLNDKIVNTWFISETRQIFSNDSQCYLYKIDEDLLYEITFIKALNMMGGLDNLIPYHDQYGNLVTSTKVIKNNTHV